MITAQIKLRTENTMTSRDRTFLNFTPAQAAQYADGRGGSYPAPLYQAIFDFHGHRPHDLVLDVGTGPGKAVWDLLPHFKRAVGCDTSPEMIEQAKRDALQNLGATVAKERTAFSVAGGEDCASALARGERADVVTVAMTAHWLDLPRFYASVAKALKPGGTLAIWTCSSMYCHPSVPNHERIQETLSELEDGMLAPYVTPGNMLSRNAYEDLALPWDLKGVDSAYDRASFMRKDWDRYGVPSAAPLPDGTPGPFLMHEETTVEGLGKALGSASMVVRWRDANPEKAYGEEDAVEVTMRRLREALGGRESFVTSPSCTLLLLRRSSAD